MTALRVVLAIALVAILPAGSLADSRTDRVSGGDSASRNFNIPRLDSIIVDGDAGDWGDGGFVALIQADANGNTADVSDLHADMRLAWNDAGLLVLLDVTDNAAVEHEALNRLFAGDSAEVFVSEAPGSDNRLQLYVASGSDPAYGSPRTYFNYSQNSADPKVTLSVKTRPGGYLMELLLPWTNLDITPRQGMQIGFQLYLNDVDQPRAYPHAWRRFVWHSGTQSAVNAQQMHALTLSDAPSPPDKVAVRSDVLVDRGRVVIKAVGPGDLGGEAITISRGSTVLRQGTLREYGSRSSVEISAPLPNPNVAAEDLEVAVADQRILVVLDDLDVRRRLSMTQQSILLRPFCFTGRNFPTCDFERPLEVEQLIGPYRIEVTWYDADFNQVSEASQPGRYGAVIDVIPETGSSLRRYRTAYRQPAEIQGAWWRGVPLEGQIILPPQQGIDPQVAAEQNAQIVNYAGRLWWNCRWLDAGQAVLLAGLSQTRRGDTTDFASDVDALDAQWWLTLRRRLYDLDQRFPGDLELVRQVEDAAPVLREGSPAEAGMKPAATEVLDAICREWAQESGEGFTICLARRGVIVLHRAYGQRDGRPMTLDTPSWLASITKLFGGTAAMMLVDRGIIDLDEPVSTYLPAFSGRLTDPPITVRDLFRHTSGLPDVWPPLPVDLENALAELTPLAQPGRRWQYNNSASELGGRAVENASGEALASFYKRHLFGPLGCRNIVARGSSGDATATALDLAKLGQMLLNKGAYGNTRFFSEETFERMIPSSVDMPEGSPREAWGIAVAQMAGEHLGMVHQYAAVGPRAFGHGSASATTFLIDPDRKIVLTIARNQPGPQFGAYATRLVEAILGQIED